MKHQRSVVAAALFAFVVLVSIASTALAAGGLCENLFLPSVQSGHSELDGWLTQETRIATTKILENISRDDGLPGAVIAARTRANPNYYYHWVRDAGLVVESLVERYRRTSDAAEKILIRKKVLEYVSFSKGIQDVVTLTGLGEPKLHVDGTAFNDMWGRPQNDSPAIRAISLITFALTPDRSRKQTQIDLYDGKLPSNSLLKRDLEYVAHHWRETSWDIWEEVRGDHFYTRMVQRRALLDGAELASVLKDFGAAKFYREQALEIEKEMETFWDSARGHFVVSRPPANPASLNYGGLDNKIAGLDIAVILGLLHGSRGDGFMKFSDDRVLATIRKLEETFAKIYPINWVRDVPGLAIGRYPEDMFSGADRSGGNPWVLATLAIAEAYFRASAELRESDPVRAQEFFDKGDDFLKRVRYHAHSDGSLNEQINAGNGFMHSVEDLTWSYAAVLTAHAARERARNH